MPLLAALTSTPLVRFVVVVMTPLVLLCVPVGSDRSSVPPALRLIALRSKSRLVAELPLSTTALLPAPTEVEATAWLLTVLALPVSRRVPPVSERAGVALMIFVVGAVAAEKSRFTVPWLIVVVPV